MAVLETFEPIAYAAPGNPGCVVVSSGLLAALEPAERRVVFAHERAHLEQHHHRYLLVGSLAVAVVPLLTPLVAQLRLATERCADEAAVREVEGDRELVAASIARAALATLDYRGTVGAFGGGTVGTRVEALTGEPSESSWPAVALGLTVVLVGLAVSTSSLQLHHFVELWNHLCGHH